MNQKPTALVYQERVFLICAAIFISSLVACNLIFQKFFEWQVLDMDVTLFGYSFHLFTFKQSVGILPYPVTFLVTDIVSEIYGRKRANQIVVSGFIASVFVMGVVLVADAVPQMEGSPVSKETFHQVFGMTPAAVFASMCAYLTAQFIDIRLFHFWKRLTKGKHLWVRNNFSTICSQLIDTFAVLTILCYFGVLSWEIFGALFINGFLFKLLFALCDTPLFYFFAWFLRGKMGLAMGEEIPEQQSLA